MGAYLWEKYIIIVNIIRIQISIFKKEKIQHKLQNYTTGPTQFLRIKKIIQFSFVCDYLSDPFLSSCYIYSLWSPYHRRTCLYCFLCCTLSMVWVDFLWLQNGSCHVTSLSLSVVTLLWFFCHISRARSRFGLHKVTFVSLHFNSSTLPASKRFL